MKSVLTINENETDSKTTSSAPANEGGAQLVSDSFFNNAEIEGDFDRSDFKIPKLNLVQNVGPLTEHFQPGVFVYNKETDLGSRSLEITLVHLKKYFIEDVEYGSGKFPDIVNSEKELRSKGAFLTKEKRSLGEGQTYYKPTLDATVLIKGRPEDASFPFDYDGIPYALAVWTLQSVAYGRTATTFITSAQLNAKAGLSSGIWTITPKREKIGANWIWLPVARQTARNTPDFTTWAKTFTTGGTK